GWWFNGTNYPYGEHLMYTDAQPALSLLLTQVRKVIPIDASAATLVLHMALMLAFFLAIIYVYKLLVRLNVQRPWAVLFACIIICFSAQHTRLFGLYGLAYACFMPMLLYWSTCYYETSAIRYM